MPEAISAYINAYARGLKSRLLTKPEIESMLENGRLEAIGETLLKSQYEVEMAEALSRYSGVEAIDDAVSRNLVNTFARLKAMCREETARLADIFIGRWDLNAVKALLRNRHHGLDARSGAQVFAFAASLGLGFGGGVVCLMAVLSNYYGVKVFPSLAGIAVAVNTLSSVAAPYVAGRLYDIGYGYHGSFMTFSLWCLAGAIVLFALRPPTRRVPQLVAAESP